MHTEPMALTGYIQICILCKESQAHPVLTSIAYLIEVGQKLLFCKSQPHNHILVIEGILVLYDFRKLSKRAEIVSIYQ